MATIFQKTPTDKVLILGPQDALVYPFDLGNWTEIRAGIETYLTASSGFTFTGQPYAAPRTNNPENAFFFGFAYRETGQTGILPLQNQTKFVGHSAGCSLYSYSNLTAAFLCLGIENINSAGRTYTIADQAETGSNSIYNMKMICSDSLNFSGTDMTVGSNPRDGFKIQNSGALQSLSTNYIYRNGFKLSLQNKSQSGAQRLLLNYGGSVSNSSAIGYDTPNMTQLSNFISNISNAAYYSATANFLFTSGFSTTGNAMDIPNSLFIYNPFPEHNIAISNILIEKYA